MHSVLTLSSAVILTLCIWAFVLVRSHADAAHGWYLKAEALALKLRGERDRVTVAEREIEALRRELRKLSGKFYAEQRKAEEALDDDDSLDELAEYQGTVANLEDRFPVCENWQLAKQEGPRSKAAQCQCVYCLAQRAERARLRGELVPRTVQGQAELARLNAAKP